MTAGLFALRIVTPQRVAERQASYLRLRDASGHFGVMRGHADLVTVLEPGLGYYRTEPGAEVFLAVDGGLFTFAAGRASIASREVFEGPDAAQLARRIEEARERRRESERVFAKMVEGLGREFLEQTLRVLQRRAG